MYKKVGKMQKEILIKRKAIKQIEKWYSSKNKKCLLITGARQVGKTFLIREFLKASGSDFLELNFLNNDLAKDAFETSKNAEEFLLKISALAKKPLKKQSTIIFIDEVQEAKEIITKIKFLVEDNSYRYILSGSLLGVELKNVKSIPVGYMDIIEMFPLDFEEFIRANNVSEQILEYLHKCYKEEKEVDSIIHQQMIKLFNLYLVIGGFPEVVREFLKSNDLMKTSSLLESIDRTYLLDISKYDLKDSLLIKDVYDLIPSELNHSNKRFILKDLNTKSRFYSYEESFVWLIDSNIGLFVYNANEAKFPLLASKERTLFKLFLCDVGLLTHKICKDNVIKILNGDVNFNFGALYESAVAQELKAKGFKLFYYNNKKFGEVDFLIEINSKVVPIEVKSGKDYKRHAALNNLVNNDELKIEKGIVYNNSNLKKVGKILYLPIYMIMFLKDKQDSSLIYKPDLSALK